MSSPQAHCSSLGCRALKPSPSSDLMEKSQLCQGSREGGREAVWERGLRGGGGGGGRGGGGRKGQKEKKNLEALL